MNGRLFIISVTLAWILHTSCGYRQSQEEQTPLNSYEAQQISSIPTTNYPWFDQWDGAKDLLPPEIFVDSNDL